MVKPEGKEATSTGNKAEVSKEQLRALLEGAEKAGRPLVAADLMSLLQPADVPILRLSIRVGEDELFHVDYPLSFVPPGAQAMPGVGTMWPRMEQPAAVGTMWPRMEQPAAVGTMWPRMEQPAAVGTMWPRMEQPAAVGTMWPRMEQPAAVGTMWPRMEQPAAVGTMWPRMESPAGVGTMWPRMEQPMGMGPMWWGQPMLGNPVMWPPGWGPR